MMTSNNSPLLKGSQELTKTKGTIWKPLITVSLLSVFSFISGQYFPYVIIAVSGSGPIAAVPLAIFAVSTVVALISTIYLIRLAVSRADSKKEAGLDGEESGHIASQEPQKFVCENCTSLENKPIGEELIKQDSGSQTEVEDKSNVSTPTPPPVTLGTQLNSSVSAPPPPPPMPTREQLNQASVAAQKNSANTTGEKSPVSTTQKNTTTGKSTPPEGQPSVNLEDILESMRKLKKTVPSNNSIDGQQGSVKGSDAVESNQCTDKKETPEEYAARIEKVREGSKQSTMGNVQDHPHDVALILRRRVAIEPSESESADEHENDGYATDDEWDKDEDEYQRNLNLQQDSTKRSKSPDSDYGSGSELTSPSHPAPKAGKPLISPKPVNLKTKPEAPPASQVNNDPVNSEVQDPPTSSLKDRIKLLNLQGGSPVFPH